MPEIKKTKSYSNIRPRKRFGQHWLRSEKVLEKIVTAAELKSDDIVLEIGSGTGILSRHLLSAVESLVAVEIDRDLCEQLRKTLGKQNNFFLIEEDFLKLDLNQTISSFAQIKPPNKVVANIPYNITAPILEKLLGTITQPVVNTYESIVLLVQKEVGDRLIATPENKAYGALSVRIQYLANCELICTVPAKAFYPPPKVDSAVVKLVPRQIETPVNNPRHLDTLIKLGFSNRRKMLRNNLQSIIEPERLTSLLQELNIDPQTRGEKLSLEQWITLSNILSSYIDI